MAEKVGIEETLDIFKAIPKTVEVVHANLKDGMQVTDVIGIASGLLASEIVAAVEGSGKIRNELGDLDIDEYEQLVNAGSKAIFDTLRVFRGPKDGDLVNEL